MTYFLCVDCIELKATPKSQAVYRLRIVRAFSRTFKTEDKYNNNKNRSLDSSAVHKCTSISVFLYLYTHKSI